MSHVKSFMSIAFGLILTISGFLSFWAWFATPEWGSLPVLGGLGLISLAVPWLPPIRKQAARIAGWMPVAMATLGFLTVSALFAVIVALGAGENKRNAAHPDSAPGVVALIRPAAMLGVPEAAQHLGLVYFLGQDGPKDTQLARYWTARAAEAGNAGAQLELARYLANGVGGPTDGEGALAWAERAATGGLINAYNTIGNLYMPGGALPEDITKANLAFSKGAELGDPESMFNLGLAYEYGLGVRPNPGQAFELYMGAAELGLPEAKLNVGVAYMNGSGVAVDYNEARTWLEASKEGANAEIRDLADENLAAIAQRLN